MLQFASSVAMKGLIEACPSLIESAASPGKHLAIPPARYCSEIHTFELTEDLGCVNPSGLRSMG